jgi:hypothetical protein
VALTVFPERGVTPDVPKPELEVVWLLSKRDALSVPAEPIPIVRRLCSHPSDRRKTRFDGSVRVDYSEFT